jgi:DNA modification methylase
MPPFTRGQQATSSPQERAIRRTAAILAGRGDSWSLAEIMGQLLDDAQANGHLDEAPPRPKVPITQPGDIWLMGPHRLLCGDSTNRADVKRLMQGKRGVLMATDPPYGIDFKGSRFQSRQVQGKWRAGIQGDKRQGLDFRAWLVLWLKSWFHSLTGDSAIYTWTAQLGEGVQCYHALRDAGLFVQGQIAWVKNVFSAGGSDYRWQHEVCWYGFWKNGNRRWFGGRDQSTVWRINRVAGAKYLHPNQKPVELYHRPIRNHTKEGEIVCEPFAGAGTQFIAAQQLGRVCYGMEIDPAYCDVTVARWLAFCGGMPFRERDGASWVCLLAQGPRGPAQGNGQG